MMVGVGHVMVGLSSHVCFLLSCHLDDGQPFE